MKDWLGKGGGNMLGCVVISKRAFQLCHWCLLGDDGFEVGFSGCGVISWVSCGCDVCLSRG